MPLDQLVDPGEAPRSRDLVPLQSELTRVRRLARKLAPRLAELGLVPVELVLDRAQPPHPDRRPLDRTDRRARVGPEVAQSLPQRLPLHRTAGQIVRKHAALPPVARGLGPDRALAHDFPGFTGIHRG